MTFSKPARYILTPEFHRNLWMKFSPFRLLAGPAVPVLWFMLCRNAPANVGMHSINIGMFAFYYMIVVLWGCYEAASALRDEVKGNTWDFQRMSSISPWQLVLGKLLGATSYVWYIGLMSLPFFVYGYVNDSGAWWRTPAPDNNGEVLEVIFYMVLAGLIGQAMAFLVSFVDMVMLSGKTGKSRVPRVIGPFLLGVSIATNLFVSVVMQAGHKLSYAMPGFYMHHIVTWFGVSATMQAALTAGMFFMLFWLMFGAYRMARAELLYRTTPIWWAAFVASLLVFLGGFAKAGTFYYHMQLFSLFMLALGISYGIMLLESSDDRKYARFFAAVHAGNWRAAFENMHKWLATVPLVLVMYLLTLSNVPSAGLHISFGALGCFMVSLLLFAARDGLVIHAAMAGSDSRHVTFKLLFYYLLVYLMFPSIQLAAMPGQMLDFAPWAMSLFGYVQGNIEMPPLLKTLAFYFPLPVANPLVSILPVLAEVILAGGLLLWRLRRNKAVLASENA